MPSIKLQSSDGEIFLVDVEIAKQSVLLLGMDEGDEEVVPLPNVNSAILKKVIQWATYHKDDPPLPEDDENKEKRTDDICSWDADFLKVDQGTLFELILAANYLDIKVTGRCLYKGELSTLSAGTPGCHLQDCGQHDQRQNPRGNQKNLQHKERLHPGRGGAGSVVIEREIAGLMFYFDVSR